MKIQRRKIQPRDNLKLAGLLRELGVTPAVKYRGASKNGFCITRSTWSQLHDYYDAARARYRARATHCHPDRRGSHSEAVALNALWEQIKERFGKHGIPTQ